MLTDNKKVQLPPRAYYPIKKAAELLNIGLDDILYLAEMEYIHVLRHFCGMWIYESDDYFGLSRFAPSDYSYDQYSCLASTQEGRYQTQLIDYTSAYRGELDAFSLSGFLAIIPSAPISFFQKMIREGHSSTTELSFILPFDDSPVENTYDERPLFALNVKLQDIPITLDDLFISYSDMQRINSIDKETYFAPPKTKPNQLSAKTSNSQISLIYALLKAYCPASLDSPTGQVLTQSLSKKGVEMPVTPEALAGWLKRYSGE